MEKGSVSHEIEATVNLFESELKQPNFPDDAARRAFYILAHGVTKEFEAALLGTLQRHRPYVARVIQEELENV